MQNEPIEVMFNATGVLESLGMLERALQEVN